MDVKQFIPVNKYFIELYLNWFEDLGIRTYVSVEASFIRETYPVLEQYISGNQFYIDITQGAVTRFKLEPWELQVGVEFDDKPYSLVIPIEHIKMVYSPDLMETPNPYYAMFNLADLPEIPPIHLSHRTAKSPDIRRAPPREVRADQPEGVVVSLFDRNKENPK